MTKTTQTLSDSAALIAWAQALRTKYLRGLVRQALATFAGKSPKSTGIVDTEAVRVRLLHSLLSAAR
ncbi:MAG: hypothetical protein ACPGNT_07435 [Rhodospirillales bacterium]